MLTGQQLAYDQPFRSRRDIHDSATSFHHVHFRGMPFNSVVTCSTIIAGSTDWRIIAWLDSADENGSPRSVQRPRRWPQHAVRPRSRSGCKLGRNCLLGPTSLVRIAGHRVHPVHRSRSGNRLNGVARLCMKMPERRFGLAYLT